MSGTPAVDRAIVLAYPALVDREPSSAALYYQQLLGRNGFLGEVLSEAERLPTGL